MIYPTYSHQTNCATVHLELKLTMRMAAAYQTAFHYMLNQNHTVANCLKVLGHPIEPNFNEIGVWYLKAITHEKVGPDTIALNDVQPWLSRPKEDT